MDLIKSAILDNKLAIQSVGACKQGGEPCRIRHNIIQIHNNDYVGPTVLHGLFSDLNNVMELMLDSYCL